MSTAYYISLDYSFKLKEKIYHKNILKYKMCLIINYNLYSYNIIKIIIK